MERIRLLRWAGRVAEATEVSRSAFDYEPRTLRQLSEEIEARVLITETRKAR